MSSFLSEEENNFYINEGYLVRENQFTIEEVNSLRDALERAVDSAQEKANSGKVYYLDKKKFVDVDYLTLQYEPKPGENILRVIEPAHILDEQLYSLIRDKRITDPVRSILKEDEISLWTDKLNLKRPGGGSGFGWHQDSPYWIHDSKNVDLLPNVYLSLDDADEDNGCFRVIRASHKEGCLPGTANGTQLGGFYTDPNCFNESDAVNLRIPAGSLVFFNQHIVHGSEPNLSDQQRRAYIITYQPKDQPMLKSRAINNIN
tara:strand:- start:2697 stop:3476 length:780 start_codon:yes stop_codon:yes gene_type:complete